MKTKCFLILLISTVLGPLNAQGRRSNPIVSHMFTADPSAHVWDDGRLYVYPSTDNTPPQGYKTMDGYHVFSTDDMITWKDHGEILHSSQVEWGRKEGGFMWAPDCAYKNGTYYYYFPHPSGTDFKKTWKIGVATSTKPASDFKVQGYIEGLESLIDPCVFIDDDGQAYLYHGGPDIAHAYKLKDNMTEIDGERHLIKGLDGFREGLFVFKRNDLYYAIYPDDFPKYNKMRYGVSDNPFGPFECKGVFLDHTDIITMHGSAVEFKNQWYVFYHNGNLSGGVATNRSICFEPLEFNADGTINMVEQTLGVDLPVFHQDKNFNAMFGSLGLGNYTTTDLKKNKITNNAISSIQVPSGYTVEVFEKDHFKGKSWSFEEDRINLEALGCNDVISSLKISKKAEVNLVKNGSFELATQGELKFWPTRANNPYTWFRDHSAKGYYALKYTGSKQPKPLTQKVNLKLNTSYLLTVQLKIEKGSTGKVGFDTKNGSIESCNFELDGKSKSGTWQTFACEFNNEDLESLELRCLTSSDFNGTCYWDNIVLKEK
ncbi:family 43 glycosylhydrolase [Tamlana sp. 1_MG-2023]|uniref:family 43 glycosylhydrolase n=1 Tax=Tamlana sp. 1_MG-2023 TaxID=3062628 RepID=UPI0026E1F423|nr:family 43 glycosylhydrolase [Tamlana sp. 1_MG-2023]MDO6792084.1 family 43 glycosylhydrolase [Tamlana sp. 1_MG-2023]